MSRVDFGWVFQSLKVVEVTLIICESYSSEVTYLLKFICNPQANTWGSFVVIMNTCMVKIDLCCVLVPRQVRTK
jgi:hypothetical protein